MTTERRAVLLAKAARTAHVHVLIELLNNWAQDPTPENRRKVGKAMDRYSTQIRGGLFPAPDSGPFGTHGAGQRLGLPGDLPALLREARAILPTLREAEEQAKAKRIADALERSRKTREARKAQKAAGTTPMRQAAAPVSDARPPWE